MMCGIARRVIQHTTEAVAGLATDRAAGVAAEEAHRGSTVEISLRTMRRIASLTMYDTTVRTTSRTVQEVVPQAGVSVWLYRTQIKQLGQLSHHGRAAVNDTNSSHPRQGRSPPARTCRGGPKAAPPASRILLSAVLFAAYLVTTTSRPILFAPVSSVQK
jgi:hypothetical protein